MYNMADSEAVLRFFLRSRLITRTSHVEDCDKGTAVRIKRGVGRKKGEDKAKSVGCLPLMACLSGRSRTPNRNTHAER